MPAGSKRVETRRTGRWFAPPAGGYSGLGPNGEVIARKGKPPKLPATAQGLRDRRADEREDTAS